MKTTTSALLTYLNNFRPRGDTALTSMNLFTVTLGSGPFSGTVLTYTDFDVPVSWNGYTYLANSVLMSGLRYKCTIGVVVDKQKINISARSTDTIGGIPFLAALRQGLLDGAYIQREKAYVSSTSGALLSPIGTVIMFKGRVEEIESLGRSGAVVNVASDLILLDYDFPRNTWGPNCSHVFCDSGCGLNIASFSATGTVGSGPSVSSINWSGSGTQYVLGTISFTSGVNTGVTVSIKNATSSSLVFSYPLPTAPAAGDSFIVAQGCDHTQSTCSGTYSNLSNYRGYPYVPPPQIITGPLSSTYTAGGK